MGLRPLCASRVTLMHKTQLGGSAVCNPLWATKPACYLALRKRDCFSLCTLLCAFLLASMPPARRMRRRRAAAPKRRAGRGKKMAVTSSLGPVSALSSFASPTYTFSRNTAPVLLTKTLGDYAAMTSYQLADLPNYSEFTALFDSYIIDKVILTFRLSVTAVTGCTLFVASDYDGGPVPAMADMVQKKHREVPLTIDHPTHSFSFKPRLATSINALSGSALSGIRSDWVDCATPTALWYGCAFVLWNYNTSNTTAQVWTSQTFVLRFRAPR